MKFEKANIEDIDELIGLRVAYICEDYTGLTDDAVAACKAQLTDYYKKHLGKDLHIYVARNEEIVSCAFLLVTEKPYNPTFPNGLTGTVLNVYTVPEARRQGLAKRLMEMLIADAQSLGLDYIELKATESGYQLYKALGFKDAVSRYHPMKYEF